MFLLIIPKARFALRTMLVMCSDHESFADSVTPKYFADDNFLEWGLMKLVCNRWWGF